jgi:hypothetical protein
MIWIVHIPPEYDGLDITSPAISYVLHNKPSADLIALVELRGGTITVFDDPFDGSGDITVEQDGINSDLTDYGDGDYSYDPIDQYETDVDIIVDGGSGVTIKINFKIYQPINKISGGGGALPIYAMSGDYQAIYKISNDDGTSLLNITNSDFPGITIGTISNFVCSDNGYLYFFWIGEEGLPIETHCHLVVVDPGMDYVEVMDIGWTGFQGVAMLAYDRAANMLYLEADDFPTSDQTTIYTFTRVGAAVSSNTRDNSSLGYWFSGMSVYDGVISYTATDISGDAHVVCDGVSRFSSATATMTGDILSPTDGYVYALYSDAGKLHLVKIDPVSGEIWTYDFPAGSTTLNTGRNLYVNDNGYSMTTIDIGGMGGAFILDPDGNYYDGGPVNMRGLDNSLSYFVEI